MNLLAGSRDASHDCFAAGAMGMMWRMTGNNSYFRAWHLLVLSLMYTCVVWLLQPPKEFGPMTYFIGAFLLCGWLDMYQRTKLERRKGDDRTGIVFHQNALSSATLGVGAEIQMHEVTSPRDPQRRFLVERVEEPNPQELTLCTATLETSQAPFCVHVLDHWCAFYRRERMLRYLGELNAMRSLKIHRIAVSDMPQWIVCTRLENLPQAILESVDGYRAANRESGGPLVTNEANRMRGPEL